MSALRSVRLLAMLVLLVVPGGAWAEVWVESSPSGDRAAVERLAESLDLESGGTTVKVLRRFVRGSGWQYVLRVDGVADVATGRVIASSLKAAGARGLVFEESAGEAVIVVDTGAPNLATTTATSDDSEASGSRRAPDVRGLLKDAARRHGGERGGLEVVAHAQSVVLEFLREIPVDQGTMRSSNRYTRVGQAIRLDVDIIDGPGTASVTLVTEQNAAWVHTSGEPLARDPARTREVLARFAPESVLAIPLSLARDISEHSAWSDLSVAVTDGADRSGRVVVTPVQSRRDGLQSAEFSREDSLLAELKWSGPTGTMEFHFADYREVAPSVVVPWSIRIERNGVLVEAVSIQRLELDAVVDPAELSEGALVK